MSKTKPLNMMDFKLNGGTDIPLSHNPFDLSPALTPILSRIETVRKNLNGRPLVVLMAEDHHVSSHVLLQYLTLFKLHQRYGSKVGFATELPWNVAKTAIVKNDSDLPERDLHGQATLSKILSYDILTKAPVSHSSLLKHCSSNSISTCFADAAVSPGDDSLLDIEDHYNNSYLKEMGLEDMKEISLESPLGVAFRNAVMAERIINHMKEANLDIMVVGVGAAHIFGYGDPSAPLYECEYSLARQFEKMGIPFMCVLPLKNAISLRNIPKDSVEYFKDTIAVTQIDEKDFVSKQASAEMQYILKVMTASGILERRTDPQPTFR